MLGRHASINALLAFYVFLTLQIPTPQCEPSYLITRLRSSPTWEKI